MLSPAQLSSFFTSGYIRRVFGHHNSSNYQPILSSGTSSASKASEMAVSDSFDDAPTYTEPVGRIVKEVEIK